MLTVAMTSTPTRRVGSFGLLIPATCREVATGGHDRRGRYDRRVIPLVLFVVGVLALVLGWLAMRRLGGRARIGRILAVTPVVGVAEARALAERGSGRYVGVAGRIDSEHEFEDERQRPLVFRHTRLETRSGSAWTAVEDIRQVAPFDLSEGVDSIAVDGDQLDEGLIVVSRESHGTAAEIPDQIPEGTPPSTPVRLRIEQLSGVDHALALGVPFLDPVQGPILRAGMGRPLILTNLERDEAMRLLAAGRRWTARTASALLAAGVGLAGLGLVWGAIDALR